ncbi:hypothetical protein AERO9AM_10012 [Aeromicrobium sp. 9AM]|nr:hypothetical protein AERO9AM_10012 [Aeromicrobium sp. 9AM]
MERLTGRPDHHPGLTPLTRGRGGLRRAADSRQAHKLRFVDAGVVPREYVATPRRSNTMHDWRRPHPTGVENLGGIPGQVLTDAASLQFRRVLGAGCKSDGSAYAGSNPAPATGNEEPLTSGDAGEGLFSSVGAQPRRELRRSLRPHVRAGRV